MSHSNINPCDINYIPSLDLSSFLAILQSIARFEKARHTALPVPALALDDFATKTWNELEYSEENLNAIVDAYQKMFSIKTQTSLEENFNDFAKAAYNDWLNSEKTVTFFTSGSTGVPKPCTHKEEHLRQELIGIIPHFKNCKRALVTVPLHHLYGFTFAVLLPKALNIPTVFEVPFPQIIINSMQEFDLLVALPLIYDKLAEQDELTSNTNCGKNIYCISGTAPLKENTFSTMLSNGFYFLENFGSSELGVICNRTAPDDYFTLLPQFNYSLETQKLTRTLPDASILDCPLQDNFEWRDERHFRPKGRIDSAVQVGSVNVFPEKIRSIIKTHPFVEECLVRLMRKEEGSRLKSFIILNKENIKAETEIQIRKQLRDFMQKNLTAPEIPASVTFGEELPKNYVGKPTDW